MKKSKKFYTIECHGYWFDVDNKKFVKNKNVKWGKRAYSSSATTRNREEAFDIQDKLGINCVVTEWVTINGKRMARDYTLVVGDNK
jgi:NDP-sugar pyrophosphorylase family protein